jgi:hypothetical protein
VEEKQGVRERYSEILDRSSKKIKRVYGIFRFEKRQEDPEGTEVGLVEIQGSREDTRILVREIGRSEKNTEKYGMRDPGKIQGDQRKIQENQRNRENQSERSRGDRETSVGETRRSMGNFG